ncbi:MAG: hypothetical protein ACK5UT_23130, partial [Acidobacteriota bacterium]
GMAPENQPAPAGEDRAGQRDNRFFDFGRFGTGNPLRAVRNRGREENVRPQARFYAHVQDVT